MKIDRYVRNDLTDNPWGRWLRPDEHPELERIQQVEFWLRSLQGDSWHTEEELFTMKVLQRWLDVYYNPNEER